MIAQILSWFLFMIVVLTQVTRTPETSVLIGLVVDDATGEPVSFVNVYIANSLMGTTTNDKGEYRIEHVPFGKHQLVVSMMGYESILKPVTIFDSRIQEHNYRLKSKLIVFPEIYIEAPEAKEWRKNFVRFEREFLGRTNEAFECEILNPEVLNFEVEEERGLLRAKSIAPLLISNMALGYTIIGELIYFNHVDENCDYLFLSKFEELDPEDEKQDKYWQLNRKDSYFGSFRHFFISLLESKVKEEGFLLSHFDVSKRRVYQTANSKKLLNLFVSPGDYQHEVKFHFDRYIEVSYTDDYQTLNATISSLNDTVAVSESGRILESGTIMSGYWYTLRVAHALPLEYQYSRHDF